MRSDIRPRRKPRKRPPVGASPSASGRMPPPYPTDVFIGPDEPIVIRRKGRQTFSLKRSLVFGVAAVALVTLGTRAYGQETQVKSELAMNTKIAKDSFVAAKESLAKEDYPAADKQFAVAGEALHQANQTLAANGQLDSLVGGQASGSVSTGQQLLTTGELIAESGRRITGDLSAIHDGLKARGNDLYQGGEVITGRLPSLQANLKDAETRVRVLGYITANAKRAGTAGELREVATEIDQALPEGLRGLTKARTVVDNLPALLGTDRFKQYLVMFENPAEIRATGGFTGTYGRVTINNGSVKELLVDSIYDPSRQIPRSELTKDVPEPYRRFYPNGDLLWSLQDANWSPDFPTSARQFQKFYEKSGGPTTDGVMALTTLPILKILQIVGPIAMPEYDFTLTADNFHAVIQADQVHRVADLGDTDPKKVLRDFMPKLLARIGQADTAQKQAISTVLADSVASRDIQLYFNNDKLEQVATDLGLDGQLGSGPNFLSLIETNIGGRKSSFDINTELKQEATIDSDGRVTTSLTLTRTHLAATSDDLNGNHTRLFLPKGSEVVASDGFSEPATIDEQDGHTVVGGFTDVAPHDARTIHVTYKLPQKISLATGEFPWQYRKQAGMSVRLVTTVTLPDGYAWTSGGGGLRQLAEDGRTLMLEQNADTDMMKNLSFRKAS